MTDKEYYGLIQPYEDAMKLLLTQLQDIAGIRIICYFVGM